MAIPNTTADYAMNKSKKIHELMETNRHFYEREYVSEQAIIQQVNKDFELIHKFLGLYEQRSGPRVGDFLQVAPDRYTRFSHAWGTVLYAGSVFDSYYLGKGYITYSGSCGRVYEKKQVTLTGQSMEGRIWTFSNNWQGAGRGIHLTVPLRVFKLVQR